MSNLLYLHSFPWDAYVKAFPSKAKVALTGPAVPAMFSNRKNGVRPKPISPMGLSAAVLDAWAPRFKEMKATAWLKILKESAFALEPARVAALHGNLTTVLQLASPKLACKPADIDEFTETFQTELVEPLAAAAKKRVALCGLWT